MNLVFSSIFNCQISKSRDFDIDIRAHLRVLELGDIDIIVVTPEYTDYDMLVVPVRQSESFEDPFSANKEDSPSFFSSYESKSDNYVHSSYVSPDLQSMEPLSQRLHRPLGRFDDIDAISSNDISFSTSDDYVALNFLDISAFKTLEIMRIGLGCIYCSNRATVLPEKEEEFEYCFDFSNILYKGLVSGTDVPLNQLDYYCGYYYGVIYVPLAKNYYFRVNTNTCFELQINDNVISKSYSTNMGVNHDVEVYLETGFHILLLRHVEFTGNDGIRLYFKNSSGINWSLFTVDNLRLYGMEVYSIPYTSENIADEKDTFFVGPKLVTDMSLNSLFLKYYKPVTVLARLKSKLLQKEFSALKYFKPPSNVAYTGHIIDGIGIDTIYDEISYTFPYDDAGIVFDLSEPITISYHYDISTSIDWFELIETKKIENHDYDEIQSIAFEFAIKDAFGEYIHSLKLFHDIVDLNNSTNIDEFIVSDDQHIKVVKKQKDAITRIKFKNSIDISMLRISDPVVEHDKWGNFVSLRVYGDAVNQIRLVDARGLFTPIDTINTALSTVSFEDVGFIPSVYKPSELPKDLKFGGEFIMFCVNVLGTIDDIQVLGNTYINENSDQSIKYNSTFITNIGQITLSDSRHFNFYSDKEKSNTFDWSYLGLDRTLDEVVPTDYANNTITIINTDTVDMTNTLITVFVPNVGHGYTALDATSNPIPICGKQANGDLVSDETLWRGNLVTFVLPSLSAGDTTVVTISAGNFSDSTTVIGNINENYVARCELYHIPLAVTNFAQLPADQKTYLYALEDTPVINSSYPYDMESSVTVGMFSITELSGNDRVDIEIKINVREVSSLLNKPPFVIVDAMSRNILDTVGMNYDGTLTDDNESWDGHVIVVRVPLLPGGVVSNFLLRIRNFSGDPSTYSASLNMGLVCLFHFSGNVTSSMGDIQGIPHNIITS